VNVSFKFEENPSISKGVIERTKNWRRTDRQTDRPTDATKRIQYSPPPILWWGYNYLITTLFTYRVADYAMLLLFLKSVLKVYIVVDKIGQLQTSISD